VHTDALHSWGIALLSIWESHCHIVQITLVTHALHVDAVFIAALGTKTCPAASELFNLHASVTDHRADKKPTVIFCSA
jgi:hypothetical protein